MKARITLLVVTVLMLLGSAGMARADDNRQVWRDTEGEIVHNTWGTCVRSMWIMDYDPCAPRQESKVIWQAPPPQPHTVIAQENRTVYFAFNKADLTSEGKDKLNTLSGTLMAATDIESVQIVGYADRIGSVSYNEALSKKRAEHVRDFMISRGYVKGSETKTHWVGKSEPTAQCAKNLPREKLLECLQPDRRVVVEVVYKKLQQPGAPQAQPMPQSAPHPMPQAVPQGQ